MEVTVKSIDGSSAGNIDLSPAVFGIEPNNHVVYQAVRAQLTNSRQGTSKAKERAEVRGGGRKPWRQKGRGTARAGTIRSPLWIGGGTIFGPRPRFYKLRLPERVLKLAKQSAFSLKAQDGQVMVIDDFSFDTPKTAEMAGVLKALELDGVKTLLLTAGYDKNLWLSGRNIPKLRMKEAANASTYDLLDNQMLLIQKSALPVIEKLFEGVQSKLAADSAVAEETALADEPVAETEGDEA